MNSDNLNNPIGNIGYYFYRRNKSEKFTKIEDIQWTDDLEKKTINDLFGSEIVPSEILELPRNDNILSFELKTIYPGLLIGIGYNHEAIKKAEKDKTGDYQLGFYFDHTTGLPVIPGSTIKGLLKSVFPNIRDDDKIMKAKTDYIFEKINANSSSNELKNLIEKRQDKVEKINLLNKIFFERKQVFFDAIPIEVEDNYFFKANNKNNSSSFNYNQKRLFGEDFITPHKDIFKNPIPIRFLKVMPGVTYKFKFLLFNYDQNCYKIDRGHILNLFKSIILDFGIGAKRNVGYGSFIEK